MIRRYKSDSIYYISPNDSNRRQTEKMKELGVFSEINTEIGDIFVAQVNLNNLKDLFNKDYVAIQNLIAKS